MDPGRDDVRLRLSGLLLEAERLDEAEEEAARALGAPPGSPEVIRYLVVVAQEKRRLDLLVRIKQRERRR